MSGVLDTLLEAFNPPPAAMPQPRETPGQSAAIGARQAAAAQASIRAGWNASKHPRGGGGKFGYTTGGKRATRARTAKGRTMGQGSSGALVKAIQAQLHIPADGKYGPQTRQAVVRYQRQHGLLVDGVIGRQTLAALRGHANPRAVKPGPIASKAAPVVKHPATRTRRALAAKRARVKPGPWSPVGGAPQRMGGGTLVP